MIRGIGVDIVKISRIRDILAKPYGPNFTYKVLSKSETEAFSLKNDEQKVFFVAGRWAAKEALVKALNCKELVFAGITILPEQKDCTLISSAESHNRAGKSGEIRSARAFR